MNAQRKIANDEARFSVVGTDPRPVAAKLSPEREAAVEQWRGEAPAEARAPGPLEAKPATEAPGKKGGRKRMVIAAALVLALGAASYYGYDYMTVGRFNVSTDDAYVRANNTTLGAKVPGYVSAILVEDNSQVRAGDVIARIDDGDYRLAVETARNKVATQTATVDRIGRQITAQEANVDQTNAQLLSAQAAAKRAQSEFERQKALSGKEFASQQTFEQAIANRDQSNAAVQSAQAAIESAKAQVDVLKAQQQEAAHTRDELQTSLAKAERDLSFTELRAPIDGVIGNRAMQVGDYVQTGQRLASLVPLSDVFVDANFKETQVARLKPGQPVSIKVDAMDGHAIEGVVDSVAPASGSVFSLLPPDNATGNFTKIVQRLPVRIRVAASVAAQGELRPGMSVVASVNTKPGAVAALPLTRFVALPRAAANTTN